MAGNHVFVGLVGCQKFKNSDTVVGYSLGTANATQYLPREFFTHHEN
jgi:hypothetical protein